MIETLERRATVISRRHESDFQVEYGNVPDEALFDDIVSYLGEYRFNLPKFSYSLKYSDKKLRDPHRLEPMEDLSQRAINLNILNGNLSVREQAEKLAFQKLDRKLEFAQAGNTIIWVSPPGPKEQGYGDYGFVFFGKVAQEQNREKNIEMTAIRIDEPTIDQLNKVFFLLGFKKIYALAEDFLANPEVLGENISEEYVDSVLKMVFAFTPKEKEQEKFQRIIHEMFPSISDFTQSLKNPWKTKADKIKELYSLENYALKLKRDYEEPIRQRSIVTDFKLAVRLTDMVGEYGYKPPKVAGSCPSKNSTTLEITSSNIFSKGSFLNDLFEQNEWFNCPKCKYQADGPIGNQCPGCGLTKESYAEESGVTCD